MFKEDLVQLLESHKDPGNAFHMKAYMRNQFGFYGIKAALRRELLRKAIQCNKAELAENYRAIVKDLYALPEREFQLCAIEILKRFGQKNYVLEDIELIAFLICTHSWWDTVDYIAKNLLGTYLQRFPDEIPTVISRFSEADNIWLNRSTILFQLGYKQQTDENVLFEQCRLFSQSDEFFIQKAIGWALREYAKIEAQAVLKFVNSHQLKPLSRREAIRNIMK